METVGDRVRQARSAKGMTMDELAKAIGKRESYISELERGGIKKGSQLHKLAPVLEVTIAWLETGKGPKHAAAAMGPKARLTEAGQPAIIEAYLAAAPETKAAIDLLLLPKHIRQRACRDFPPLIAGITLLEADATEAMKALRSA